MNLHVGAEWGAQGKPLMGRTLIRSLKERLIGHRRNWESPLLELVGLLLLTLPGVWRAKGTTSLLLTGRRMNTWQRICFAMNFILLISEWWIIVWRWLRKLTMSSIWLLIWVVWASSSPTTQLLCITTPWSASICLKLQESMGLRG